MSGDASLNAKDIIGQDFIDPIEVVVINVVHVAYEVVETNAILISDHVADEVVEINVVITDEVAATYLVPITDKATPTSDTEVTAPA
ncbi:unnamed protein product [Vicia faba]|uniref:Uncharacterized protein n=1 Tax=Vicia faba TaxID=3906 RepID=A0AAV1B3E3_VICFA|nr:unnamed protein product [Vicia faba]